MRTTYAGTFLRPNTAVNVYFDISSGMRGLDMEMAIFNIGKMLDNANCSATLKFFDRQINSITYGIPAGEASKYLAILQKQIPGGDGTLFKCIAADHTKGQAIVVGDGYFAEGTPDRLGNDDMYFYDSFDRFSQIRQFIEINL